MREKNNSSADVLIKNNLLVDKTIPIWYYNKGFERIHKKELKINKKSC